MVIQFSTSACPYLSVQVYVSWQWPQVLEFGHSTETALRVLNNLLAAESGQFISIHCLKHWECILGSFFLIGLIYTSERTCM